MTQALHHSQTPANVAASTVPSRELPVNDPPPSDGSQPPVQDPPVPQPDSTLQQERPTGLRRIGPVTDVPVADIDLEWPNDLNPEAHESAV